MEEAKEKGSINANIEKLFDSPWWIVVVSIWILIFHCLGLDMLGFGGLVTLVVVMCLFCSDFRPMIAPCMMGVLVVSTQNSPGYTDGANYYFTTPVIIGMVTMGIILVGGLIFNFTYYQKWHKLIIKSSVSLSLIIYSLALVVSGFFVATHKRENFIFILATVASLMVVYVMAKGLVKKRDDNLLYLARVCSAIAVIIAIEIGWVYVLKYDFSIPLDSSWVGKIVVGFSVQNMASEIIVMMLPALFYLVYYDPKRCVMYFGAIVVCMIGIFFAFCRTSILFGTAVFGMFSIFCMIKGKGKVAVRYCLLFSIVGFCAAALLLYIFNNTAFNNIANMWLKDGRFDFGDGGRYVIWEKAMEYFRLKPIFGNGFTTYYFEMGGGEVSWYVYLFHNTIFQLMGSAGLVGLFSLLLHRLTAFTLFIKSPSVGRTFFGISLLACIGMGLIDLIMFVPYVLFYYSLILAFCETSVDKRLKYKKPQNIM